MQSIYNIYESIDLNISLSETILSDMKISLTEGDDKLKQLTSLSGIFELKGIAGIDKSCEKLFDNNITEFESLPYISQKYQNPRIANEFPGFPNYKSFAKFLERLQPEYIGWKSFDDINTGNIDKFASDLEKFVKANGLIKKAKNIAIDCKYFNNGPGETQLQIYVNKLDKEGNIYKSKGGRVQLMYIFFK
jgi:hypothetical protein